MTLSPASLMIACPAVLCAGLALADGARVAKGSGVMVDVPSGQRVVWQDVVWNVPGPDGLTTRFRFVAPEIGKTVSFDQAEGDMAALCETFALPRLAEYGPAPAQVVISLADREMGFGEVVPEAVQYFEAYRVEGGTCQWEMF